MNNEDPLSPIHNLENNIIENSELNDNNNFNEDENIKGIYKLKEMNSNMDLILTGLKCNLESGKNKKQKQIINYDIFIQQINTSEQKNTTNDNNISDKENEFNNSSNGYFSELSMNNFNFEIINRKKYFIDINKLDDEEKTKLKFIFGNNLNNNILDLDEIINYMYDYKNIFDNLKNTNKLILEKNSIDEEYFKDIVKKNIELNKIEKENEILRKEINFLIEGLTNSFYNGNEILTRYYNQLNQINNKIQNNIEQIISDS